MSAEDAGVDVEAVAEPVEGGDVAAVEDDVFVFSAEDGELADAAAGDAAAAGGDAAAADGEVVAGEEDVFAFSEGSQVPGGFTEAFAGIAKEVGVGGKSAAALIERAWAHAMAQQEAVNKELGAELRKDWGSEFNAKVGATKAFAVKLAGRAGLSVDDMKPMMSPYGFRLLNAMREMVQEGGGFAGAANAAPKMTPEQEIDRIYETPELWRALTDSGDPRHKDVNERLNKLMGLV